MRPYKPVVLVILDGWGESPEKTGNAIAQAQIPTIKKIDQFYPKTLLQASGISVGLPWGESGNSEVGHQTIGTGQISYQNLPRITLAIEDNSFFSNATILEAFDWTKKNNSRLHFLGLLSDGAVHSHIDHLLALLEMAKEQNISEVFIHAITDGRDTAPKQAESYIQMLEGKTKKLGLGKIASLIGRYYTMDRNENWDRIQKGYALLVKGQGIKETDPQTAIKKQYQKKLTDEYIEPIVIVDNKENPIGNIQDNDAVIFFNFREDRARQIAKVFCQPNFDQFPVDDRPKNLRFVGMVEYEKGLPEKVAFPAAKIDNCLGKILSENNKKQLRIAETEKYAHVTYFFNGGNEKAFPGEDHVLIPSKKVPSYSQIPQMSAVEITDRLLKEIQKNTYDFILVNYANADMVGHTGDLEATIKAVETLNKCLEKLIPAVLENNGCLVITADHGNAEQEIDIKTGIKSTEHSANPVPCWLITPENHRSQDKPTQDHLSANGIICDIAPTILDLMDIPKPESMECDSLLPILK